MQCFDCGACDIGACRINVDAAVLWRHHKVHVFHWNGPQEHLIAANQSAAETDAVLEAGFDVGKKRMNRGWLG